MASKVFNNFIRGKWKASSGGETFENVNPAKVKEVVGRFQQATPIDLNDAVSPL